MKKNTTGFTIVELLVVIVVIAILAAISVVAYRGIQSRARDAERVQHIKAITTALEMYYIDHGQFPTSACGSACPSPKSINAHWATTVDGSWSVLEAALVPKYISSLPTDPLAGKSGAPAISGGYHYDYVVLGGWCSAPSGQLYLLAYQLESGKRERTFTNCDTGSRPAYHANLQVVAK